MLHKLCLTALCLVLATVAFAQTPRKITLAVMDLAATGISKNDGAILAEALLSYLVNTNYYEIVERSKRDEILKEQGFALSGACNETACLIEIGKFLAVQKMVGGSIGKLGNTWTVNIRLLDVKTGKVDKACMKYYKGEIDQMLGYMNDIAQEIIAAGGPTKEQLEAIRQKSTEDSIATAKAEQARLIRQKAVQDSLVLVETANKQRADKERLRKQFVTDSLVAEAKKTKLKMPVLTYSTLGGSVLLAGITYLYYAGAQDSYDKYNAATTPEDAATFRDETESKNTTAAICSYAAIGTGTVYIVSLFLRKKAHPELSKQTAIVPEINLTSAYTDRPLTPSKVEGALKAPSLAGKGLGLGLTWRF